MDYTTKLGLAVGALGLLLIAWVVWKFFASLFKYFVIGLLVIAVGAGLTLLRKMPPPRNPAMGKHAYLKENGKYLGVVETQGEDNQLGEIWGIRPPGGNLKMYSKSRVELKDKYEPAKSSTDEPSSTPAASEPARKGKKDEKGRGK